MRSAGKRRRAGTRSCPAASAVMATVLLAIGVAAPGSAAAKAHRSASTKAPALPATGDWEGTGNGGTTASFEVATERSRVTGSHNAKYRVIEDFAADAPIDCTNADEPAIPFDVETIDGPLRVSGHGTFSSPGIDHGSGTEVSGHFSGRHFLLSYRYESQTPNQFAGGTEVCDTGSVRITAAPGHRRLVKAGVWYGETETNEPVVLYVSAGGRVLEAPPRPPTDGSPRAAFAFGAFTQTCFTDGCTTSSNDICAYESPTSLFVAADGAFSDNQWLEGDDPIVAGAFTGSSRASGQFANGPEGCGETDWSAEAG